MDVQRLGKFVCLALLDVKRDFDHARARASDLDVALPNQVHSICRLRYLIVAGDNREHGSSICGDSIQVGSSTSIRSP